MVDLEVLGSLVVRADGTQRRLAPALRVLLLCLLCAEGELVPAGRLAGLVSRTAVEFSPATLRSHVSHLRRAIGDATGREVRESAIVTDKVGGTTAYALRMDAVRVDASRFVRDAALGLRELQAGDAGRAANTLRSALGLWRGQPLSDAAGYSFAQAEIKRLDGAYRAALVARVHADALCGLDRSITGELEALVGRWPDDEALRVLLVTCLYRSGRTSEAARACRDAIEFTLQHGLEPRRLAALQMEVLNGTLPRLAPAVAAVTAE